MTKLQTENDFGQQLYRELRNHKLLHILTNRFNYSDIQRLKRADREATIMLFTGAEFSVVQALKSSTASEVAEMFWHVEQERAKVGPTTFLCF